MIANGRNTLMDANKV